jgi:hypothetical protein
VSGGTVTREPTWIIRVEYDDPCSGCGTPFTHDDLAMMSNDGCDFWCFSCVSVIYEAMKAARG